MNEHASAAIVGRGDDSGGRDWETFCAQRLASGRRCQRQRCHDSDFCATHRSPRFEKSDSDTTVCRTCGGDGVVDGPRVKRESPVAPGLMIWQRPVCPDCGGQP